jgi:hypothetical protein
MSQHPSALYRALCDLADAFEQRERDLAEYEARLKALEARGDQPYKPSIPSVGICMPDGTINITSDPAEIAAIFAKDDA